MAFDLKSYVLPENGGTALESAGTVSSIIKDFKATEVVKTKFSLMLINAEGQRVALGISKAVGTDLESGKIAPAQLGNLNVIKGQNAKGEDRLYISYSNGGSIAANEFLAAAEKAKPVTRKFSVAEFELGDIPA